MKFIKGKTILVVDDEKGILDLMAYLLEPFQAKILMADDGAAGFKIFTENPQIDVVITDLKMPNMSGSEMCTKIHAINKNVPVIMCTAFGDEDSILRALRAGVFEFIHKPFQDEFIIKTVQNALEAMATRNLEEVLFNLLQDSLGLGGDVGYKNLDFEERMIYMNELVTVASVKLERLKNHEKIKESKEKTKL
jgi:DNA-binding NtrC family response regulator